MILHVDRAWLLEAAQQYLRADPDVTDWGALAAVVVRHADEVMGTPVYPEAHHRAAALLLACCAGHRRHANAESFKEGGLGRWTRPCRQSSKLAHGAGLVLPPARCGQSVGEARRSTPPRVPRKHVERIIIGGTGDGDSQEDQEIGGVKLGAWVGNQRSKAASLSPERIEQLSAIAMRWT